MSEVPATLGAAVVAVGLSLWAGLLALVQESPAVARTLGDAPKPLHRTVSLYASLHVSRMALLVLAAAAGALAVEWWTRPSLDAAARVAVASVFLFLVADVLPRAIGVLVPRVATAAAPFARRTLTPFRPLLGIIRALERLLQVLIPAHVPVDLPIRAGERDLLAGVVSLRGNTVAEVMTPRLDVAAVDARREWREVVEQLRRSEHARLPVYNDDLDQIIGILYAKDVTPVVAGVTPALRSWHELIRPAAFVPESKSLAAQLRDFQRGHAHLAIVVDEFGGTSGLVTLEDVLEEVVGEIHGEYDAEAVPPVIAEGDDKFWVDGAVTLDTLSEALHAEIVREDVSTVGGLIYSELGRVPRPGEELRIDQFRVVVEQVSRRRIRRVYFERMGAYEPPAPESATEAIP